MLTKLLKYEVKAAKRFVLPILLVTALLTIVNKALSFLPDTMPFGALKSVTMFFSVAALVISILLVFVLFIQRFYRTMAGDEGYHTHTLPVTTTQIILSKWLCAFVGTLLTAAVIIGLGFLLIPSQYYPAMGKELSIIQETFQSVFNIDYRIFFFSIIAQIIAAIGTALLTCFTCIGLGQLMNKYKVASSFAAYFVIYAIMQVVNLIIMSIFFFPNMNEIIATNSFASFLPLLITAFAVNICFSIAFFFVTRYMFNKKLNLE